MNNKQPLLRALLVLVALFGQVGDASSAPNCDNEPCRATLADIVQYPGVFQNKRVVIQGVLDLRFEGHSIRHGKQI